MADYEFRYELRQRPQPHNDGSVGVSHDIFAVSREVGAAPIDPWNIVPGRHKSVVLEGNALIAALASGTNGQKTTKYKNLIRDALIGGAPLPLPIAWDVVNLEALMDANDVSIDAANKADEFITVDINKEYPVRFTL